MQCRVTGQTHEALSEGLFRDVASYFQQVTCSLNPRRTPGNVPSHIWLIHFQVPQELSEPRKEFPTWQKKRSTHKGIVTNHLPIFFLHILRYKTYHCINSSSKLAKFWVYASRKGQKINGISQSALSHLVYGWMHTRLLVLLTWIKIPNLISQIYSACWAWWAIPNGLPLLPCLMPRCGHHVASPARMDLVHHPTPIKHTLKMYFEPPSKYIFYTTSNTVAPISSSWIIF